MKTLASNQQDVERMHEVLCCAGTTMMLRYYDYYKGTGFGKASKADIRNFRCPIKSLMQGDATHKRRTSGTKEVHAHAAHLDDEDVSCACCADQQPKRVKFAGPWPTLRGTAQPPELKVINRRNRRNRRARTANLPQNGRKNTASAQEKPAAPAQGEPAPTAPASPAWQAMPAR